KINREDTKKRSYQPSAVIFWTSYDYENKSSVGQDASHDDSRTEALQNIARTVGDDGDSPVIQRKKRSRSVTDQSKQDFSRGVAERVVPACGKHGPAGAHSFKK